MVTPQTHTLAGRPRSLQFNWTQDDLDGFSDLAIANQLWTDWLKKNQPSEDQIYRKLLMDLFPEYRVASHYGSDFSTIGAGLSERYAEFNRCTGEPIRSSRDYVRRCEKLLTYGDQHRGRDSRDHGMDVFLFVLSGDCERLAPFVPL